jgi:hypothetical protein
MQKVRIWADLDDEVYRAYEGEARRRGVTVESIVEQVVNNLLRRSEREGQEGFDHPIVTG